MQWWVVAAMVVNGLIAIAVATAIIANRPSLRASYEPGFPADLLVLSNRGTKREVVLLLDDRYAHRVRTLGPGIHGFEVQRAFEDDQANPPQAGYVPRRLLVMHGDGREEVEIIRPADDS